MPIDTHWFDKNSKSDWLTQKTECDSLRSRQFLSATVEQTVCVKFSAFTYYTIKLLIGCWCIEFNQVVTVNEPPKWQPYDTRESEYNPFETPNSRSTCPMFSNNPPITDPLRPLIVSTNWIPLSFYFKGKSPMTKRVPTAILITTIPLSPCNRSTLILFCPLPLWWICSPCLPTEL